MSLSIDELRKFIGRKSIPLLYRDIFLKEKFGALSPQFIQIVDSSLASLDNNVPDSSNFNPAFVPFFFVVGGSVYDGTRHGLYILRRILSWSLNNNKRLGRIKYVTASDLIDAIYEKDAPFWEELMITDIAFIDQLGSLVSSRGYGAYSLVFSKYISNMINRKRSIIVSDTTLRSADVIGDYARSYIDSYAITINI